MSSEHRPLHARLYDELMRRIESGVWGPGERIPSETDLIAEFSTSRATVRQALARLRSEGLLVGGRGARPRVPTRVGSQSFDTFMSFTEWAEGLGHVPGARVIVSRLQDPDADTAEDLGLEPGARVAYVLRLRTLDGAPMMLERSSFPPSVGEHLLRVDLDAGSIYQSLRALGRAPARARHVIDAVAADAVDAAHLGVRVGSPLLRVRRVSYDASGGVLESADDRFLPELASFTIENTTSGRSPLVREVGAPDAEARPAG